jgi:hypothetical protein
MRSLLAALALVAAGASLPVAATAPAPAANDPALGLKYADSCVVQELNVSEQQVRVRAECHSCYGRDVGFKPALCVKENIVRPMVVFDRAGHESWIESFKFALRNQRRVNLQIANGTLTGLVETNN